MNNALPPQPGATPTIELGVAGPHHQTGFLLRVPLLEALRWDLENEVGSARRAWMEQHGGWWIAHSYLQSVVDIVLRFFPSVLVLNAPGGDRLLSRDGISAVQQRLL
jgi:hypothetical protein